MIEVLVLIALGRAIAARARIKGRSGGWFAFLLVVLWVGGEVAAAVGVTIAYDLVVGGEPEMVFLYLAALAGAAAGAGVAFAVVYSLQPIPDDPADFE